MPCKISCIISSIFIIGMIYMTNSMSKTNVAEEYKAQLPEHLLEIYDKIVKERTHIYYTGFIIGLVIAGLFFFINKHHFVYH